MSTSLSTAGRTSSLRGSKVRGNFNPPPPSSQCRLCRLCLRRLCVVLVSAIGCARCGLSWRRVWRPEINQRINVNRRLGLAAAESRRTLIILGLSYRTRALRIGTFVRHRHRHEQRRQKWYKRSHDSTRQYAWMSPCGVMLRQMRVVENENLV